MEINLGLTAPLKFLVSRGFRAAKLSEGLLWSETELMIIKSRKGVPLQLRYCPALVKKPTSAANNKEGRDGKPKPDPFEKPPSDLLLAELPYENPSHILVLNKYPVIPNHFILATKASKPQTDLLEETDLGITYACLKAWASKSDKSEELFAFFNSGDNSGASQVHRHLQFLPVEDMRGSSNNDWTLLLHRMTERVHPRLPIYRDPSLPFVHFAIELEDGLSISQLHSRYKTLLKSAVNAVNNSAPESIENDSVIIEKDNKTVISYNLAMTTSRMAICPRRNETVGIPGAGTDLFVSINGTILGGTLMVKDENAFRILQEQQSLIDKILETMGYPSVSNDDNAMIKL